MAREWALAGVSPEELQPDPPVEPPKTPKGKWQNFWYHYKWQVVAVAFALVVAGVCTWQILTRDDPDYRLVLVTKKFVSTAAADHLGTLLEPYGEDLDQDGKVEIKVEPLYVEETGENYTTSNTNAQKLSAYLATGDVMFFAIEPSYYEERIRPILSEDYAFFAALPTDAALEDDGRAWNWKGSALQENAVMRDALPESLWFGVRAVDGTAVSAGSETANRECQELLLKLIEAMAESGE